MANCTICGSTNLGTTRTPLVLVDSQWFCSSCLKEQKGAVKCSVCGGEAFSSGEHYKSVGGKYLCTACLEKAGITTKYDYVVESASSLRNRPQTSGNSAIRQQPLPSRETLPAGQATPLTGGLRMLLDEHTGPGEVITTSIAGNAGEGIACSRQHVYVLKTGIALGSITGRKCTKIAWNQVKDVTIKESALYGILEIAGNRLPEYSPNDIAKAKKSDNAVTFLASRKSEFEQALKAMRNYLADRQNVAD